MEVFVDRGKSRRQNGSELDGDAPFSDLGS